MILEIILKSTSFCVQTEGIFTFLNIGYRMALAEATVSVPTLSEATPVKGAKAVDESRTSDSSEYLVFVFGIYRGSSPFPLLHSYCKVIIVSLLDSPSLYNKHASNIHAPCLFISFL